MKGLVGRFLTILTAVLFTACASTPNTFANADPTVDFSNYRTYGYFEILSTDNARYQSLVSSFLKVAVSQELDRRGLSYDPENPDIRVNFYINTQEKIRSRTVPTMRSYYDYRDSFYDPWAGYGGYGGGYETQVDQYTVGTLNIDVVDAASKKLVWEGAVSGRLTDNDVRNMEQTVDEAVGDVMAKFPIPPLGPT